MDTKTKIFEIALALVILVGIASIPFTSSNQTASIGSFFGPDNTNETVLKAQTKLNEMGLYDGNLSGLFGLKTRFAIYRFQEATGLARTGILDIPTQKALFSFNVEPEYLAVSYTDEGNTFLAQWARYILGVEGKRIELRGKLNLVQEDAMYQNLSTRLVLDAQDNDSQYSIFNISFRDLDEFIGKDVIMRGLYLPDNTGLGSPSVLINHIEAGDKDFPIAIGYSEDGNNYARKWTMKVYQETHEFSGLIGTLSVGRKVLYAPGGQPTSLVLSTSDGTEYSVENLSSSQLTSLVGQDIMVRGLILNNLNSSGRKTIVINYIIGSEENPSTGAATTGVGI